MIAIEYLALRIINGIVLVDGVQQKVRLPEGCKGLFMLFDSEDAGRKYWGEDVRFVQLEVDRTEPKQTI